MEDKDFDQLFKDHFADAEVAPAADLWGKIEQELEPKKKTILPAYWMAAAVALVVVTIGLLMPKTEKIQLRGSADFVASTMTATDVAPKAQSAVNTVVNQDNGKENNSTPLVIAPRLTEEDIEKDFAAMQPIAKDSHPVIIDAPVEQTTLAQVNVPSATQVDEMMIASANIADANQNIAEPEQVEHKGIRNVGDLVNMVVNKVDKRDKKLIQFSTDEDDNSSVIGINLGFLKFNKRDK